ncbi:MAG: hypothetical protein AAF441_17095 [Pseudomonadota bacterium]
MTYALKPYALGLAAATAIAVSMSGAAAKTKCFSASATGSDQNRKTAAQTARSKAGPAAIAKCHTVSPRRSCRLTSKFHVKKRQKCTEKMSDPSQGRTESIWTCEVTLVACSKT